MPDSAPRQGTGGPRFSTRLCWWLALSVLVVALDQWSKALVVSQLVQGQPLRILPLLDFSLQYNSGAAFSLLSDAGGMQRWLFSALALVISVVLLVWMSRLRAGEWLLGLALAFILGGAVGNLWDRLRLGHVVDFISVHYGDSYFPIFNLADSAITLGVILMLLDTLLQKRRGIQ